MVRLVSDFLEDAAPTEGERDGPSRLSAVHGAMMLPSSIAFGTGESRMSSTPAATTRGRRSSVLNRPSTTARSAPERTRVASLSPAQQMQSGDHHGLAGAGLPGQHGQAAVRVGGGRTDGAQCTWMRISASVQRQLVTGNWNAPAVR